MPELDDVEWGQREYTCPVCGYTRLAPVTPHHDHDGAIVAFTRVDVEPPTRRRKV